MLKGIKMKYLDSLDAYHLRTFKAYKKLFTKFVKHKWSATKENNYILISYYTRLKTLFANTLSHIQNRLLINSSNTELYLVEDFDNDCMTFNYLTAKQAPIVKYMNKVLIKLEQKYSKQLEVAGMKQNNNK